MSEVVERTPVLETKPVTVSVEVSERVLDKATTIADSMGLPLSTCLSLLLTEAIHGGYLLRSILQG